MALSFTLKFKGGSGTDATNHATASFTPVAGRIYLIAVAERNGSSTDPGQPTATFGGTGLSSLTIPSGGSVVFDNSSSSRRRLTVFYAIASGSPTSGTITFNHSTTMTSADWSVTEVDGADTSTPVVQAANNFDPGASPGITVTATLSAFSDAANGTYGAAASGQAGTAMTVGSGFSSLSSATDDGESGQWLLTQYKTSNDTSVDATGDNEIGVVGLEIKDAAGSGGGGGSNSAFLGFM